LSTGMILPGPEMKSKLHVFVYGTLKRGFPNHHQYCTGVLRICPAWLRGKLFKLTAEIPAMTVPDEDILVHGTANAIADIEAQERFESLLRSNGTGISTSPSGGPEWGKVRGELLIFDDPQTRLPLLDSLEEFRPGRASTYVRVLVYITLPDGLQTSAWTYIAGCDPASLEVYAGENWEYPL
jgi:gamma-glutamylcyclotransferase (GGCT)/AIG2-like uncharacterized protein YtfP